MATGWCTLTHHGSGPGYEASHQRRGPVLWAIDAAGRHGQDRKSEPKVGGEAGSHVALGEATRCAIGGD
jgi:hypothetical protein